MGKAETVAKYAPAFLKGKNQEAIDRFYAKDVEKQYSSIMVWRRKMRLERSQSELSARNVVEYIRESRNRISKIDNLTDEELAAIDAEIRSLLSYLDELREARRQREIRRLQEQQEQIARRLEELRGKEERNLFSDME